MTKSEETVTIPLDDYNQLIGCLKEVKLSLKDYVDYNRSISTEALCELYHVNGTLSKFEDEVSIEDRKD